MSGTGLQGPACGGCACTFAATARLRLSAGLRPVAGLRPIAGLRPVEGGRWAP